MLSLGNVQSGPVIRFGRVQESSALGRPTYHVVWSSSCRRLITCPTEWLCSRRPHGIICTRVDPAVFFHRIGEHLLTALSSREFARCSTSSGRVNGLFMFLPTLKQVPDARPSRHVPHDVCGPADRNALPRLSRSGQKRVTQKITFSAPSAAADLVVRSCQSCRLQAAYLGALRTVVFERVSLCTPLGVNPRARRARCRRQRGQPSIRTKDDPPTGGQGHSPGRCQSAIE